MGRPGTRAFVFEVEARPGVSAFSLSKGSFFLLLHQFNKESQTPTQVEGGELFLASNRKVFAVTGNWTEGARGTLSKVDGCSISLLQAHAPILCTEQGTFPHGDEKVCLVMWFHTHTNWAHSYAGDTNGRTLGHTHIHRRSKTRAHDQARVQTLARPGNKVSRCLLITHNSTVTQQSK